MIVLQEQNSPLWLSGAAQALYEVCKEGFIVGGAFYEHFFSGKFGPTSIPVEFEVLVADDWDPVQVSDRLSERRPDFRWHVSSTPSTVRQSELFGLAALKTGRGGVRWSGLCVEYFLESEEVLGLLEQGLLIPDGGDPYLSQLEARNLLTTYPALQADFIEYSGKTVHDSLDEIHDAVKEREYGGRTRRSPLATEEHALAEKVRDWHRQARAEITAVPIPPRSSLPVGDPWTSSDEGFREWIIDQAFTKYPRTQRDQFLHASLEIQYGEQKPTHQGWETYQHALMSMLVLETDHLPPEFRRALRVTMLFHDIGKACNIWTPGCHAMIGARQWRKFGPDWLTDDEKNLISLLIRTHDLLGLMDRGLVHPNYRGSVAPEDIREELSKFDIDINLAVELMTVVYKADVGSVAALRWLLPLTPILKALIQQPWHQEGGTV